MSSLACDLDLTIVLSSTSNFLDKFPTPFSDDENEDKNPAPLAHVLLVPPAQLFPRWVRSTCEVAGDIVDDPRDQRRTRSQFQ